jgi:hypothetical protein
MGHAVGNFADRSHGIEVGDLFFQQNFFFLDSNNFPEEQGPDVIKDLDAGELVLSDIVQDGIFAGQLDDEVNVSVMQKGTVIRCRRYPQPFCMAPADCIGVVVGYTNDIGFEMNGGVSFEQVQDVIAPFPATDKGHINNLLVHTGLTTAISV